MGIVDTIKHAASVTKVKVGTYSPEILVGVGVVGVIGGAVLACKATLHVEEVIDKTNADLASIQELSESPELMEKNQYTEQNIIQFKTGIYIRSAGRFLKLYAPALAVGALGIISILSAHHVLRQRNAAWVAAYGALQQSFEAYRKRVSDDQGAEKEREFFTGTKVQEVEVTDEKTGKKTKKKEVVRDANGFSIYAKCFDETNPNWQKNAEYNRYFLQSQQNFANDKLHADGYLFLNDVYEALGLPKTSYGQLVGWVCSGKDANGDWISETGDGFVDFGIFSNDAQHHDFVNGWERSVWLDFNVDGVVYDLLQN